MKSEAIGFAGVFIVMLAGCGKNAKKNGSTNGGNQVKTPPTKSEANLTFPKTKATALIKGRVVFEGTPPKQKKLAIGRDQLCVRHNEKNPLLNESLVVSDEKGIRDVVVFIKSFPQSWDFETPAQPVRIIQKGCRYIPHVVSVMEQQAILVKNDDRTSHNVHIMAEYNMVKRVNFAQVFEAEDEVIFKRSEIGAYFKCDIHSWMRSYICVFDHPFHTVTAADGSFEIGKLPPGEYEISIWHQKLGTQSQTVQLKDGETTVVDFSMKKQ